MNSLKRFLQDESGATAIEYGLLAASISVAIASVVNTLGSQIENTFAKIPSQLDDGVVRVRLVE
jgi:pilus assembly protein Flp/PilA